MNLQLSKSSGKVSGEVLVTGSKSESNRLLILQAQYPEIEIRNLSDSDDTTILKKALTSGEDVIDIHHAGTAMRFLTAYLAAGNKEVVLTGSARMQQRPVELLVNALRELGADIEYLKNEGYPPLRIKGKQLEKSSVTLQAHVSSQYISALMLIAASQPNGLEIELEGKVTSVPYIEMTLSLLRSVGFSGSFEDNRIKIEPQGKISPASITVESDWSSASYFYSIAALSEEARITAGSYKPVSHQGDAQVAKIYEELGVKTEFSDGKIILTKIATKKPRSIVLDLANSPDLAQTIAVTCFGLGIKCELTGLHTLKIKETDRLLALKTEIEKLGGKVEITSDALRLVETEGFNKNVQIATYNDHRMAMAFAPLALKVPLEIEEAEVVSKSYPAFWEDLEKLSFLVEEKSS